MTVFNFDNRDYEKGYSLFFGEKPALYDSIHVTHPELFKLYKLQKSIDWAEDEIDLEQSRIDLISCPANIREVMIENILYQWSLDSVAARSLVPLFAPFITNSEAWAALSKNAEIEVLHALTYSEIVRQCIPNKDELMARVMNHNKIRERLSVIDKVFSDLQIIGAKYTLGMVTKEEAYPYLFKGMVALFCLERIEFMSSFAATFAVVNQGYFQGIGKYVQKIMQDERFCHAEFIKKCIKIELKTDIGARTLIHYKEEIKDIVDGVVSCEYSWNNYLFSEGRSIVGLNEMLLNTNVDYNSQDVYDTLLIDNGKARIEENNLLWMNDWLDMDKFQNANQEGDNNNYSLNVVKNDIEKDYQFGIL